ncbi:Laccase abr2 [Penicillium macrosclerotiorum]|uniref:Laccase abr2 n=1 Tax=Penicillium macrosclerotiorum TaxID=303699 RepID=UPI0025476F94|nr:Laccase abr2 [Penicillium macrosclerotiorum]KAJ5682839.1 Laccase abr2 [Penicillium macrosclerotiorum]
MTTAMGNLLLVFLFLVNRAFAATVNFTINLTWENYTVAGVTREVILTNGQYPGPELRMKQGNDVYFEVINCCPFNVTVHFHGIEQIGTPWSDGVPGVSQRVIQDGDAFLYHWTAKQYGAYFYHAHHRGQLEDGLYGPIYITPSSSEDRPFSLITSNSTQLQAMIEAEKQTTPLILSDWRLLTSEEIWSAEEASGLDSICANSLLINGKGSITCFSQDEINALTTPNQRAALGTLNLTDIACFPPELTAAQGDFRHNISAIPPTMFSGCTPSQGPQHVVSVDPSQQYVSLDLTSAAGLLHLTFSIDEHTMWIYAIDGRYVEPVAVNAINIPNSNRYSVLVPLDQTTGNYTIRMVSGSPQQILNTTAILQYKAPNNLNRDSNPWINLTGGNATANTVFSNDTAIIPFPAITPATSIDATYFLTIGHYNASYRWTLGNSSYDLELEESQPLLFNQTAIPSDLIIRTTNGSWVDLVLQVDQPLQPAHPIHKHSNKHFVIGQGSGTFGYASVAAAVQDIPGSFNLVNPPIRDTTPTPVAVMGPTWLVIRYQVVNPGAFLMHCHIQVHQSGGMALAMLDGVDVWPTIPPQYLYDSGY